jgi:hypothetical protein
VDELQSFSRKKQMSNAVSFGTKKRQLIISVMYCIKKLVELVEYSTKKSKIRLILLGLVRSNLTPRSPRSPDRKWASVGGRKARMGRFDTQTARYRSQFG